MTMAKQMDKVINLFKDVIRNSAPLSGKILTGRDGYFVVTSIWSQRNIERKISVHSELSQLFITESTEVQTFSSIDTTSELITRHSPSGTYRGLIRDIPAAGKQAKKQHLEIWKKNQLYKNFDLSVFELHGDVCTDNEFGTFEWSPCESKVLYTAEKKKPKAEPFLPLPSKKSDDILYGSEYVYVEEWGEALVGKSSPILAICDIEHNELNLVCGAPNEYSLGQAVWAPDGGIVCVAWETVPRRLGLVYCTNRNSWICHISKDGQFTRLSPDGLAVRSPKFSRDSNFLIWLEREAGGPHHGAHSLVKYDWSSKKKKTVVDIVDDFLTIENNEKFYGIYSLDLGNCWLSDNRTIILSTPQQASVKMYAIDTETNKITDITGCGPGESHSQTLLDNENDYILCARSSLSHTPALLIGKYCDQEISWIPLIPSEKVTKNFEVEILHLEAEYEPTPVKNYCAIYYGPKNATKAPLIVWPHGGPHSVFSNAYSMVANFFAGLGFGMLMVNYRGSIGAGRNSVNYLLGKVGSSDVSDVHQAAQVILEKYPEQLDKEKCLLFGGSHGGFLVLHLIGQYPTSYQSVVALNPVVDLSSCPSASDIPDWALTEGGYTYTPTTELTGEIFDMLRKKSPIFHVDKVKTPVLLLLGKKDLRVPSSQGNIYYHSLKARGVKVKMLCYDDNHSLSLTPHEVDFCINSVLWFFDTLPHVE